MAADKLLAIDEVIYTRILQRDWAVPAELDGLLHLMAPSSSSSSVVQEEEEGVVAAEGGDGGKEEGSAEQGERAVVAVFRFHCWRRCGSRTRSSSSSTSALLTYPRNSPYEQTRPSSWRRF